MEWMIHQLAQRAGITSRTLRHYDRIGLLAPSRVGANGYRYYDLSAVVRVQRILWMRRLGMSLSAIAEVLSDQVDEQDGLVAHIAAMENERDPAGSADPISPGGPVLDADRSRTGYGRCFGGIQRPAQGRCGVAVG